MDSFLIDYLKSGKAWVLVGSGPSIEMGYPSWEKLASVAVEATKLEGAGRDLGAFNTALKRQDFPKVFEEAKNILGGQRLLQVLREGFVPPLSGEGRIYEVIARWPVSVYLTTNYDDEIQTQLAKLGAAYLSYSNSEDHLSYLIPGFSGAVVKLHGDLRSENGLILTTSQYQDITRAEGWKYWRTKMTSIFQMNRVVVIGHSLSDKNVRHVIEAAKQGAGVVQPICWIAPDVSYEQRKEFLEKYRIRVIPYDNQDGQHRNLLRLLENISVFIPPRTSIHIQEQIERLSDSPLGSNAAAPGFFVFNKLIGQGDYDEKRIDIIVAAIQSALPALSSLDSFSLKVALEMAGWPKESSLSLELSERVCTRAVEQGLLVSSGDEFKVGEQAEGLAAGSKRQFEHGRERFKKSLQFRAKRAYPSLPEEEAIGLASDIEKSLSGYFKEGGLSLATTLFSSKQAAKSTIIPSSIVNFISEASARYSDLLRRQAFCTVSVDAFVHAEPAERDYLSRISQGFFAFHALGIFGDVAIERLRHTKETVWLVDSNAQIPALALAAPTHSVFADSFSRLHDIGIRLFTTEQLFSETWEHFHFADNIVKYNGASSPTVIAAATGQTPYRNSNQFLEGFIRWQAVGNPREWESYLFQVFGQRNPSREDVKQTLHKIGIEVVAFDDWPGFSQADFQERHEYTQQIGQIREGRRRDLSIDDLHQWTDPYKKAEPEAEALIVVKRERDGYYHMISDPGYKSASWFISNTSILNLVDSPNPRITWQPEAFLRFASTIAPLTNTESVNRTFETLLFGFAESGLSLLDEEAIVRVFGGIIDQAKINIVEQMQAYKETIEQKYGEPIESVLERVPPSGRPLAAIQLANEMLQVQEQRLKAAEASRAAEAARAANAERKLQEVDRFRKKMEAKRQRGRRKAKKQKSGGKAKKKCNSPAR